MHPSEQRYGVAQAFDGHYVAVRTVVFGGEASPLLRGRAAKCLMRGAQGLYGDYEVAIECYVDDPIILAMGTPAQRKRLFTVFLLWQLACISKMMM